MSLRLRLALWYSGLFALVIVLIILVSYAVHTRGHYDDLDHALVADVSHAAIEVTGSIGTPDLVGEQSGLEIILRLYRPEGHLQESSADDTAAPAMDPRAVLRTPA